MKKTALERKSDQLSQLEKLSPDQRAALLQEAGIGTTSQARALAEAFQMLRSGIQADDQIRVGKGKLGRMVKRPNWPVRIAASRTLLEWLAPVVKRTSAGPSGRTVVNVVTADYARHGATAPYAGPSQAHAVVIDAEPSESDSVSLSDSGSYSAEYAAKLARSDSDA